MTGTDLILRPAPAPWPRLILAVLDEEFFSVLRECPACQAAAGRACMRSSGPVFLRAATDSDLAYISKFAIYVHESRVFDGYWATFKP